MIFPRNTLGRAEGSLVDFGSGGMGRISAQIELLNQCPVRGSEHRANIVKASNIIQESIDREPVDFWNHFQSEAF